MEINCEKNCIIFKALLNRDSFQADINRAAVIAEKEGREFDGSAGSMCGSCVARKKIKNAIEEKLLNGY
jgi:hypothetical protein